MSDMEKLLNILEEVNEDIDYRNEKNLIDSGLISSLDLTSIIFEINDAFDIEIKTRDIEPENFQSAEAMLELIYLTKRNKNA